MNMEFGTYAGEHVNSMNKLEANKLSLEKQINDFTSRISDLDTVSLLLVIYFIEEIQ